MTNEMVRMRLKAREKNLFGSKGTHHSITRGKEFGEMSWHKTRSNTVYASVWGHLISQGLYAIDYI